MRIPTTYAVITPRMVITTPTMMADVSGIPKYCKNYSKGKPDADTDGH